MNLIPAPRGIERTGGSGPWTGEVRARTDPFLPPEGYRLAIGPDGADITGGAEAGVSWARQMADRDRTPPPAHRGRRVAAQDPARLG
ncbi:glycoside hydrolase family 20 zincin-like fold domain-containing protein [Actinomadura sp. NTSP31]|uniref:glycoside hydrolase family 20 zincin-like fold domain-containing protein n=1 Tax=Actinomadura sp. NTSP31 TaxID=1735447 RepID=UPI0035C0E76F